MARRIRTIALVAATVIVVVGLAVLHFGPYRFGIIHTGSMEPTFPLGSAVVIEKGHYQIGKPVYYPANGENVAHRLISIDKYGNITTKGDANPRPDPWHAPKSAIIGGVVADPHYLGYVMYAFDIGCPLHVPYGEIDLLLVVVWLWLVNGLLKPTPDLGPVDSKEPEADDGPPEHDPDATIPLPRITDDPSGAPNQFRVSDHERSLIDELFADRPRCTAGSMFGHQPHLFDELPGGYPDGLDPRVGVTHHRAP